MRVAVTINPDPSKVFNSKRFNPAPSRPYQWLPYTAQYNILAEKLTMVLHRIQHFDVTECEVYPEFCQSGWVHLHGYMIVDGPGIDDNEACRRAVKNIIESSLYGVFSRSEKAFVVKPQFNDDWDKWITYMEKDSEATAKLGLKPYKYRPPAKKPLENEKCRLAKIFSLP